MKNVITALMIVVGMVGSVYAGDCANGVCTAPLRPVRKVVNITREVVVAPVRAVVAVAAPRNCCAETVATDCGCGCGGANATTKEVVKYQPVRRRLVNRTTSVTCCQ